MTFVLAIRKNSMRVIITFIMSLCVSSVLGQVDSLGVTVHRLAEQMPFKPGERLEMKATVGFIKAAEVELQVNDSIFEVNDRPTYKLDAFARTTGIFDLISSVRDNWGSYYDTAQLIPQRFYRYLKEGRFRKNEILYFDHEADSVIVERLHKETRKLEKTDYYPIPNNAQDMVSGYYYMRSIDFDQLKIGDVVSVPAWYDNEYRPFRIKIAAREVLKTKFGKVRAIVLVPIIKKDSLFEEDNTLKVWISDDLNKLPLKFQAKIYVGYLRVELKKAQNLLHPMAIVNN